MVSLVALLALLPIVLLVIVAILLGAAGTRYRRPTLAPHRAQPKGRRGGHLPRVLVPHGRSSSSSPSRLGAVLGAVLGAPNGLFDVHGELSSEIPRMGAVRSTCMLGTVLRARAAAHRMLVILLVLLVLLAPAAAAAPSVAAAAAAAAAATAAAAAAAASARLPIL